MTTGPKPNLLQNVDWSYPTVAAMQAAIAAGEAFVPGQSIRAAGRTFLAIAVGSAVSVVETTPAPAPVPGFNDIDLKRLPVMEAQGLLGNPNGWADMVQALTVPQVLGLLKIAHYGTLDAGGFDISLGDGTTLCKIRAGRSTTSDSAGVAITFVPAMLGCNVVMVSPRNDGAEAVTTVSWSNVNATGFTAHGYNAAGARIARDFSYIAIGR